MIWLGRIAIITAMAASTKGFVPSSLVSLPRVESKSTLKMSGKDDDVIMNRYSR